MDSLAGGDETKYDYYEGIETIHFLNLLTYRIEKAAEQERINQLAKAKQRG